MNYTEWNSSGASHAPLDYGCVAQKRLFRFWVRPVGRGRVFQISILAAISLAKWLSDGLYLMGDDFANHQVFASGDAATARRHLIAAIREHLSYRGYTETAAPGENVRSFAIGRVGRWIPVLDSSSTTDDEDMDSFNQLSVALSHRWPIVDVVMSDSAAVHFYLYRNGQQIDRFGNAAFPFYAFKTTEDAEAYRGRPELWAELFGDSINPDAFRVIWIQEADSQSAWNPDKIITDTAAVLGWEPLLCHVGYTIDYDGIPVKYDVHYEDVDCDLTGIDELHFRKPENAG